MGKNHTMRIDLHDRRVSDWLTWRHDGRASSTIGRQARRICGGSDLVSAEAQRLRGVSILLVEDDARVRDVLTLMLETEGALVRTAVGARDALTMCGAAVPSLIITDIQMPNEDGLWLLGRVRETLPNVPVIAMSGLDDASTIHGAGFDAFLRKPVRVDELCGGVRSVHKLDT
jgi:CheY-like chemotaxis protein